MNILHLKYAVEVANTGSVNKAAENLYMNQPNLSRAVKELEESVGISIFSRTAKGMTVTEDGEEFLSHARRILSQINEVEELYSRSGNKKQFFSVSGPRASYISEAFVNFAKRLDRERPMEVYYRETNSMRVLNTVLRGDHKLGILRYAACYDKNYKKYLDEKELVGEMLSEFKYVLAMSPESELAKKETVTRTDLIPFTEIAHADPFVPQLPFTEVKKEEFSDDITKRIYVYERASQFELLASDPETFMWISPPPPALMKKYGLIVRPCDDNTKIYKDVLIRRKEYKLSKLDREFIEELVKAKEKYL